MPLGVRLLHPQWTGLCQPPTRLPPNPESAPILKQPPNSFGIHNLCLQVYPRPKTAACGACISHLRIRTAGPRSRGLTRLDRAGWRRRGGTREAHDGSYSKRTYLASNGLAELAKFCVEASSWGAWRCGAHLSYGVGRHDVCCGLGKWRGTVEKTEKRCKKRRRRAQVYKGWVVEARPRSQTSGGGMTRASASVPLTTAIDRTPKQPRPMLAFRGQMSHRTR